MEKIRAGRNWNYEKNIEMVQNFIELEKLFLFEAMWSKILARLRHCKNKF